MQKQLVDEYVRSTLISRRAHMRAIVPAMPKWRKPMQSEPAFQVEGKFDPRAARSMLAAGLA